MSTLAPANEPGMWISVWKLLRLRTRITWSNFLRSKLRVKIGLFFAGFGIACIVGFVLFLSIMMLKFLRSPELAQYVTDVTPFLESFPTLIVSGATSGILLTSFSVLLQALYLAGDMDFLMSTPLPVRSIFVAKMIQALLPNFLIMCAFALPVLYGLGISSGYSIVYYPMVLVVLAVLTLAAAGLAGLLVMVAARFFPARRIAEVLGFVIGTTFFVFSQSSRLMRFDVSDQQFASMLALTTRFNQPWSPLAWAGQGLVALGKGEWLTGIGLMVVVLLLAGGVFYGSLVAAEGLYYTGWSSLQNTRRKPRAKNNGAAAQPRQAGENRLATLIPRPVRAILVKDLLLYRRDLRSISRLLTPMILGVVYAISLVQSRGQFPQGRGEAPAWIMTTLNGILLYGDVALALFVGWMLAANLAGQGVSQEGKNYWMIKTAPISPRQFLLSKYLVAYLPSLAVCEIYILILQFFKGFELWPTLVSMIAVALVMAGVNGIYLAFGVTGAKFDWESPNQMGRTVGCLGAIAGMVFVPVCFALFVGPAVLAAFLELPLALGQLVGLALGGGAGLAAAILPLGLVEKRVSTLNES
jgi:ABC-2 type transport system permease protein